MNPDGALRAVLTSFLDLICCGLGASIMLFLIAAAAPPTQEIISSEGSIMVWAEVVAGTKAEISLEYWGPSDGKWNRMISKRKAIQFSADTSLKNGGAALVVLPKPESGTHRFRAVMVNYPKADFGDVVPPEVKLTPMTSGHEIVHLPKPKILEHPTDTTSSSNEENILEIKVVSNDPEPE